MEQIAPMNGYATHLVPSITAAIHSGLLWPESPILELGCGHYSTPLLSSIAKTQGRKLHLITSNSQWASKFQDDPDELRLIDYSQWAEFAFDGEWGMVLVDHEEHVIDRFAQLFKLNEKAKVVVFHDANRIADEGVSWSLIHMLYRHVYFYDRYSPQTAILSNYVDPSEWF
ncbi:MAG: hypothetical protein JSS60_05915 [Verrucomicrobia bacterium]|nr:hypothetical protein [Verrucomicrobiota bacterium]